MDNILRAIQKASWFHQTGKLVAVAASSGAALVTLFSALYSYGVIGKAESHQSIGNLGAAWVGLRPTVDTAAAIGDTTHFAATIADKNGSILVGARPTWTTGDSSVATVLPDGSVIALGPGVTTVSVVVGRLVAHSRILVRQRVTSVEVARTSGDSVVVVHEGIRLPLHARALDARGHAIAGLAVAWQIDDSSVAALDPDGALTGRDMGRTVVTANIGGVSGRSGVSVVSTAAAIAFVAGSSQRALAGSALPQPIVVRATNRRGEPTAGQAVSFRVRDGEGSVSPTTAITDADGRARAVWILGDYPGRQTLLASVEKLDSALAVIAEAEPVAENTRVFAVLEHLTGRAGEQLADSPAVRITDSTGRALADVPVRWAALDGGTVEALADRTDSLGVARARWTLARKAGTQRLRAQVVSGSGHAGILPVTMSASAIAGDPVAIAVMGGQGQRAEVGATLPKPLVIRVVDANGNGVVGATLILSPSGGSVPDSALRTDSLGIAETRWTMGRSAGAYAVAVHMDGIKQLLKPGAYAKPGPPANLSFDDAPASNRRSGRAPRGRRLYALVTDVYGNPVADAKVSFSAKSGIVTPSRAATDSRGRVSVSWKPGSQAGEQTLTGIVRGTDVKGAYATQVGPHLPAEKTRDRPSL